MPVSAGSQPVSGDAAPNDRSPGTGATRVPAAAFDGQVRRKRWVPVAVAAGLVAVAGLGAGVPYAKYRQARENVHQYLAAFRRSAVTPRWTVTASRGGGRISTFPADSVETVAAWGATDLASAAYALDGRLGRARDLLTGAKPTPDRLSDRAAVELLAYERGEGDLDAAEADLQVALQTAPDHPEARWNQAVVQWRKGNRAKAIDAIEWTVANSTGIWRKRAGVLKSYISRPMLAMAKPRPTGRRYRSVGGEELLGGVLEIAAWVDDAPHVAIRVYLQDVELVAACPSPACRVEGHLTSVRIRLDRPGNYQILRLSSDDPIAAPQGSVEADIGAATGSEPMLEEVQVR